MIRLSDRAAIGLGVGVLAAYAVTRSAVVPDGAHLATNIAMIAVVACVAAGARLSRDEMGLARDALPAGLRVGGLAVVVVGVVVAAAVWLAGSDASFVQDRTDLSSAEMLFQVFVEIPIATVVLEELAFRGMLGPLFHRVTSPWRAVAATSVVFGLWHVPSVWGSQDGNRLLMMLGTVAATTVAGVVFQLLKDRTRSLAAPALAHWATNGLALLLVWSLAAD